MTTQTTAPDLATQVTTLQARVDAARRDRARRDHELDAATAYAAAARDALHAEFGVDTPDQARELLAQLESDVTNALTDLTTQLDAMEQR